MAEILEPLIGKVVLPEQLVEQTETEQVGRDLRDDGIGKTTEEEESKTEEEEETKDKDQKQWEEEGTEDNVQK